MNSEIKINKVSVLNVLELKEELRNGVLPCYSAHVLAVS